MITADTLKMLTGFGPKGLSTMLAKSGYTGAVFKTAKFVGITNGGQFCYTITYHDKESTGKNAIGKVFISYDHTTDIVTADY